MEGWKGEVTNALLVAWTPGRRVERWGELVTGVCWNGREPGVRPARDPGVSRSWAA